MSITIGPLTYDIVFLDKIEDEGKEFLGQIEYSPGIIRLKTNMSPAFTFQALWHEIVHAILYQYGIDRDRVKIDKETLVHLLAMGIADALMHNPQLAAIDNSDLTNQE
jgi:hypothetical protein